MLVKLLFEARIVRILGYMLMGKVAKKILDTSLDQNVPNYYTCCDCLEIMHLRFRPIDKHCQLCGSQYSLFLSTDREIQTFQTGKNHYGNFDRGKQSIYSTVRKYER